MENTALFDSIFHILLSLMADYQKARQTFIESSTTELKQFVNNYFNKGTVQQTYLSRTKLLQTIVQCKNIDGMKVLDCSCLTVDDIVENIVRPVWPSSIKSTICQCTKTQINVGFVGFNLDLTLPEKVNVFKIQNEQTINCDVCHQQKQFIEHINNVVFVKMNQVHEVEFEKVPKVISIEHAIFILSGFVNQSDQNHSIAYIQRGQLWYSLDGILNSVSKAKLNFKISPALFVYTRSTPESIKDISVGHSNDVVLLENFHQIVDNGQNFKLINLCGPDSLFHSFICLYIDEPYLFNSIVECDLLILLRAYAKKEMKTVYKYRLHIMKKTFQSKKTNDITQIDCMSNIYNDVKNIFGDIFPSSTLICECGEKIHNPVVDLDCKRLLSLGIMNLEQCFFNTVRKCNKCQRKMTHIEYNNIIFVDVQPNNRVSILEKLSDIPNYISFAKDRFRLKSVVEYISGCKNEGGHYRAHCLRNDNSWYCFDDTSTIVIMSNRTQHVCPHVLIYTRTQV